MGKQGEWGYMFSLKRAILLFILWRNKGSGAIIHILYFIFLRKLFSVQQCIKHASQSQIYHI